MARGSRRTLAWRLAMLGLVQLVLLAMAVAGVGFLIAPERPPRVGADTRLPPPLRSTPEARIGLACIQSHRPRVRVAVDLLCPRSSPSS